MPALSVALGRFGMDVLRLRRKVTLDNLRSAFPEWSNDRIHDVARDTYRNITLTFLELCRLPGLRPEQIASQIRFASTDPMDAMHHAGTGAVFVTAHMGNWELLGAALAARGVPFNAVVATQSNPRVDRFVMKTREDVGIRCIRREFGLRPILQALRRGECVVFLSDQDAGRRGVFLPFLDRPASTPRGAARFARLTGCPLFVGFSVRQPDGSFLIDVQKPLNVRADLPALQAEREVLAEVNRLLEAAVRAYPSQWFWMHRRWKTRPPDPAAPLSPEETEDDGT